MIRVVENVKTEGRVDIRTTEARRGGGMVYEVRMSHGWKTLDSPYNPRREAEVMIGDEVTQDTPCLVLGLGGGMILEELLRHGIKEVLAVTTLSEPAQQLMPQIEEDTKTSEWILVVDNDPERVWKDEILPWLQKNHNAKLLLHPRERSLFPALFVSLEARIELHNRAVKHEKPINRNIRAVLLAGIDGLLEREVIKNFRRRGFRVDIAQAYSGRPMTAVQAADLLADSDIDLVFSMNHLASDIHGMLPEMCERLDIPWATWLLDDPRFILSQEEREGAGRRRMAFCWDRAGVEAWKEMGFQRAEILPLATDPGWFHPGEGREDLKNRIVFVGSPRFSRAMGYFHLLDQDGNAQKVAEALIDEVLATRRTPTAQQVQAVVTELGLDGSFDAEALRRLPSFVVQQANLRYRTNALKALAHLNPVVFGDGWEGILPDTIEIRGSIDYYKDLPDIYRSDAVHLSLTNLQMYAYPNQRVFDVGACGRAVITDYLEGLDELFGEVISPLTFHDLESMSNLAVTLMRDPVKRKRLGDALHDQVMARHTISHRIDTVLQYV